MKDVLIVGAGPTGLALACELLRRKLSVRIIDAGQGPSRHSKALAIQSRTMECLEKMGVLPALLNQGKKVSEVHFHWRGQTIVLRLELEAPYPFILILPQSETEKILIDRVRQMGGEIEWETMFMGFYQSQCILKHANSEIEHGDAAWVAGCDGAHSQVRHALGLPFSGAKFPEVFFIADLQAETSFFLEEPNIFFSSQGASVILPLPEKDIYRIIIPLKKKMEEIPSAQDIETMLKEKGVEDGFKIKEIFWESEFRIHRRIVSQMRQKHVLLAGDAAHIHSPIGGQGMNTSIQDALNLAWKLDMVVNHGADESLMSTYHAERYPVAKQVLHGTTRATRFLLWTQKWAPYFFYAWVRLLSIYTPLRKKLASQISELGIHYRKSPIVSQPRKDMQWKAPAPGERAPDVVLSDGARFFSYLLGTQHVLLLFKENPPLKESIEASYGAWIQVLALDDGALKKKYAADRESLFLIRPDGYLAFRSRQGTPQELMDFLQKAYFQSGQEKCVSPFSAHKKE